MRYLVLPAAVLFSLAGLVWGVLSGVPANGARGGAVADMVALVALFLSRGHGAKVQRIIATEIAEIEPSPDSPVPSTDDILKSLSAKIEGLTFRLNADDDEQWTQNVLLAISTVIGTLVWGFGDMATAWLIAHNSLFSVRF